MDILNILRLEPTVFTFKEILLATQEAKPLLLKRRLNYYIKQGELYHIRRGLYAKNKNYDRLELATKIWTPSYVSFETVLRQEGIVFQYYSTIFVASYQTNLEAMSNVGILSGLGDLLASAQKIWVKNELRSETIFLLQLKLATLKE